MNLCRRWEVRVCRRWEVRVCRRMKVGVCLRACAALRVINLLCSAQTLAVRLSGSSYPPPPAPAFLPLCLSGQTVA